MRIELIEKVERKKNKLSQILKKIDLSLRKEEVLSKWQNYKPKPITDLKVAVSDGSFNKKHYLGFYLYVFGGYSILFENENIKAEKFVGDIDISVIKNSNFADAYFKLVMFLSETKALYNLSKENKPNIIILDGTISSRFITPFPKADWFIKEDIDEKLSEIASYFIEEVEKDNQEIVAFNLEDKILKKLEKQNIEIRRDIIEAIIAKIAYFELLITLSKLLNLDYKPLIFGVAKTSDDTKIFNKSVPDIRIFYEFVEETGYTEKLYIDVEKIKWQFPEIYEDKVKFKLQDIDLQYFYAKYGEKKIISLIEVYQNPDMETISQEEIIDILHFYEINGYPFPLNFVDKEVRIKSDDFKLIENILGFSSQITGREGLE
ncbi:DNA double-strand break repair nuclease NurA [Venenivibrio stagnispumantis]|uniref:NurA domain-containing protein n=1 Tax=Venenivibrio stagnispumantis TaxID=407998 RepID=A0AA46AD74_9AQUI|nr:DNA double-strand break repair nuclease NurA [Venenivibrio stagnispumantis]MCW4572422.1 DNA double-strand break repair nuclease NurA [Venenivibrio stagnispumantis]SMP03487.1 NurA domain-containing protein [Venenivibrio stagnispumantis]